MASDSTPLGPETDDWRLQTTARLSVPWSNPWTGEKVPAGTRVTLVSVIKLASKKQITVPVPNATALMLNAAARAFHDARSIRMRSKIDTTLGTDVSMGSDEGAFDYFERTIEAIILAFSALEAYVNETIPPDFQYKRKTNKGAVAMLGKAAIEREISIDEKLSSVLPSVLGCASPKGSRVWNTYIDLKRVRDRVIHMKSADRKSSGPEVDTIWKALFLVPTPHLTVKAVIDHFMKSVEAKPSWHTNMPRALTKKSL